MREQFPNLEFYALHSNCSVGLVKQEAQLPQRNSASAAHMDAGARPSSPPRPPPLATPMHMVESETRNKRTSRVPSTCRDITGRLTMQTSLGLPEDPII